MTYLKRLKTGRVYHYRKPKETSPVVTLEPTHQKIQEWIRTAPKKATIGDGAMLFGLTVDRFIAMRDDRSN